MEDDGLCVVGVDADSRRIAYATVLRGSVRAVATITRSNQMNRIAEDYDARLTAWIRLASDHGAVIVLEDIFLADRKETNVVTYKSLAVVQGEITREARRHRVPVHLVQAVEWRAKVLSSGRGREELKRLAQLLAGQVTGLELSEHESEAVCIALYGAQEKPWQVR